MRELILKGLGKAKVKKVIRAFLTSEFNEFLDCGNSLAFEVHLGAVVDGRYGLPNMDETDEFTLEELIDFVGNKI
tara:strand:+ start:1079 stop:1303 length:225 start_codon:yes stop_codon:yes gene_type:complete